MGSDPFSSLPAPLGGGALTPRAARSHGPALDVMLDVNALPNGDGRVQARVDDGVPLAAYQPRGQVVRGTDGRYAQCHTVDSGFEYLELPLVQQSWRLHKQSRCKGHASHGGVVHVE